MRPVRTRRSNAVYTGGPGVLDLWAEKLRVADVDVVISTWHLSPAERKAVAEGADVELVVMGGGTPPVRLQLTTEAGIGEDAPEILDRLDQAREAGR